MRKKRNRMHALLRAAELPQDLDPHLISVQWIGGSSLLIEQHRGILRFESGEIRFACEQGTLCVFGSAMEMEQLSVSRALIRGEIRSLSFEGKS